MNIWLLSLHFLVFGSLLQEHGPVLRTLRPQCMLMSWFRVSSHMLSFSTLSLSFFVMPMNFAVCSVYLAVSFDEIPSSSVMGKFCNIYDVQASAAAPSCNFITFTS